MKMRSKEQRAFFPGIGWTITMLFAGTTIVSVIEGLHANRRDGVFMGGVIFLVGWAFASLSMRLERRRQALVRMEAAHLVDDAWQAINRVREQLTSDGSVSLATILGKAHADLNEAIARLYPGSARREDEWSLTGIRERVQRKAEGLAKPDEIVMWVEAASPGKWRAMLFDNKSSGMRYVKIDLADICDVRGNLTVPPQPSAPPAPESSAS